MRGNQTCSTAAGFAEARNHSVTVACDKSLPRVWAEVGSDALFSAEDFSEDSYCLITAF